MNGFLGLKKYLVEESSARLSYSNAVAQIVMQFRIECQISRSAVPYVQSGSSHLNSVHLYLFLNPAET